VHKFDQMMAEEDTPIDPELFKIAKKNIVNLLVTDNFRRFQMSPEFEDQEPIGVEVETKAQRVELEYNSDESSP
jgi:hypothetical protein